MAYETKSVLDDPCFQELITYIKSRKFLFLTIRSCKKHANEFRNSKYARTNQNFKKWESSHDRKIAYQKDKNVQKWESFFAYFYKLFDFNRQEVARFCYYYIVKGEQYIKIEYKETLQESIETYYIRDFYSSRYNTSPNQKFKTNKSNNINKGFLDTVEAIIDYTSPRSAIKRIIKNLREK